MRDNYTNPFLKHPETRKKLEMYLQETQPEQHGDPVVEFLETEHKPLLS